VDLALLLAQHLHAPAVPDAGDRDDDAQLSRMAQDLDGLVREVTTQVASLVAVSLLLAVPAGRIVVGLSAPEVGRNRPRRPVLASLAVSLPGPGVAPLLVLQAADAGAFLLLADGLRDPHGAAPVLHLDQHLSVLVDVTGQALRTGLADLRAVDQAVGVLVEQGRTAQEAHQELRRRAELAGAEVAAVARTLLAALRRPPPRGD
jgi:hypothetical protein